MADGFICRQTVEMTRDNPMVLRQQPIIKGDKNALTWRVLVTRYGCPADLTGATADLYCARACDAEDGAGGGTVYAEADVLEDGVVQAVIPPDAANVPGPVVCMLRIQRDGAVVGIARMAVDAIDPVGSDIVDEGNRIVDLSALVTAAQRCEQAADEAQSATASATSAASKANQAATSATSAASRANTAAAAIEGMTATATTLEAGQDATAIVVKTSGKYVIQLGLPRGLTGATPQLTLDVATGAPGTDVTIAEQAGSTAENPRYLLTIPRGDVGKIGNLTINGIAPGADGSVSLTAQDVGARPSDWMPSAQDVGARPSDWMPSAQDVGAVSMELLWENASPSSAMAMDETGTSSIAVDWAAHAYTHLMIIYAVTSTNSNNLASTIIPRKLGNMAFLMQLSGYTDTVSSRAMTITEVGIRIGGASVTVSGTKKTDTETTNKYCIPYRVYGIEGGTGIEA